MKFKRCNWSAFVLFAVIKLVEPTCVLESDFGFKINCAFKKSGLFRVRNLGGIKAHASVGLSLGDELGFEQSLTNMDPSRRRSVSTKNGSPPNLIADTSVRSATKQEKRSKQTKIIKSNLTATDKLTSTTGPTNISATSTMASNILTGINTTTRTTKTKPQSKVVSPKKDALKVLPISSTAKSTSKKETSYTPLQIPQSTGSGLSYKNPLLHQVNDLALYPAYKTKKVDDSNTITGYDDDETTKNYKDDIKAKIEEIAKAGNISMEAVEAAIALRQQQLLNRYANIHIPKTTANMTAVTEEPQKPKRNPNSKVMNAPREYYPVGYEKNFDDHFQSKVDLPETDFHCADQKYFPGLYGDETLSCMIFHVCALSEDGLMMKSFLCPESTLFDQTILKCNWWFYVDCKNTRRLYDTNTPVSQSYQLMKALAYFSSYRKDISDDVTDHPTNPNEPDLPVTDVS